MATSRSGLGSKAVPPSATTAATPTTTSELQSSLRELSLTNKSPIKDIPRPTPTSAPSHHHHHHHQKPKKKSPPIADSWEDELEEDTPTSASASDPEGPGNHLDSLNNSPALSPSIRSAEGPLDPPPTPISPQITPSQQPWPAYGNTVASASSAPRSRSPATRRPEKQTAVAGRMIAGALGIRAPKRTEEQRKYDRAVKEQEIKRRNREREEAERVRVEEEEAKKAVWDM
ncbi:uncharacterized protein BO80DRAFT_468111 [Aspergillus ibericus CBS 121593]|uniref:Ubiquitin-like protein smt3 n=1 Tax=Aspergillus ibericus CBS 121593 TaxID=1448316 RepID=A0A395GNH0_9EURO|nr:hypothetical protein BO80DRAFT_468111 [Aspergillus ibericus CBS 121593]RAK97050.1 hypothetical protein BO80DRAFT_468111 [Aspergillus ibericus CBS 121593]